FFLLIVSSRPVLSRLSLHDALPISSGLEVLRETKQADAAIPVLLLTAYGSVEEAVAAMKEGAFDFLQKPVDLEHLKLLVQRAARSEEHTSELQSLRHLVCRLLLEKK